MSAGRTVALVIFGIINLGLIAAGITFALLCTTFLGETYTSFSHDNEAAYMEITLITIAFASALYGYLMFCVKNKAATGAYLFITFLAILFDTASVVFHLTNQYKILSDVEDKWYSDYYVQTRHYAEYAYRCCGFRSFNSTNCDYISYYNYTCYEKISRQVNTDCVMNFVSAITFLCIHFVLIFYAFYFTFQKREETNAESISVLNETVPINYGVPPVTAYSNADLKQKLSLN